MYEKQVMVSIEDCVPGMKIAETIFNAYGAEIILEDTILDDHLIEKLRRLDIRRIKVFQKPHVQVGDTPVDTFRVQYRENVEVVKELLHDISVGRGLTMEKVDKVAESTLERMNENRDIVGCISQIRSVDDYTYTHSINVSMLSMLIGKWMQYDEHQIKHLVEAGLLHDIGKSKIDPYILNKPGKLSQVEFDEIKKHPVLGYRMVSEMKDVSPEVCKGVLMHHEREDGSGYPMGLTGDQIHPIAKVLGVADIFDAMTSNRVYKLMESPFQAFELMENHTFGILDPVVVRTFLSNIAAYYIGDFVHLSTGETGEIVYINARCIAKPIVRVGDQFIDLTKEKHISITGLV